MNASPDHSAYSPGSLDDILRRRAEESPERAAVTYGDESLTFGALDGAVSGLADGLMERGIRPGERVALIAPNVPALVIALFAVWRARAVAVPLNARLREFEIGSILRDADVSAVLSLSTYSGYSFRRTLEALVPTLASVRFCLFLERLGHPEADLPGPGGDEGEPLGPDIAAVLYTSGTTGKPKGALVTHQREMAGAQHFRDVLTLAPDDRALLVIPISHAFGFTCMLASIASGCTAGLLDSTFSAGPMLEMMRREGTTVLHGSPTLFTSLLKASSGESLGVRGFVAGAACPPETLRRLDAAGSTVLNLFGMTEIGAAACCRPDDPREVRFTSVGRSLPGYEFRALDSGELAVRGPAVTPGYYRQPEQTAAAFDAGWFRTGDLGVIEAGVIRVQGRAKDVVQVGGLNVFPAEVEGFLTTHPDIDQAVVVGAPHDTMGEVLEAYIVPRPGATLTAPAILQFARPRIAGYKLPYAIHIVERVPQLPSGKPDRRALALGATT